MTRLRPLNLVNIVKALIHYNLKHCEFPLNDDEKYVYGITELRKKQIYINKEVYGRDALITVVHELAHAYYETQGVVLTEKETDKVTRMTMNKYFKK